jgi:hypothetical protein
MSFASLTSLVSFFLLISSSLHAKSRAPDLLENFRIEISLSKLSDFGKMIDGKIYLNEKRVDCLVSCGHWDRLQLSSEELGRRRINLLDHLSELLPREGRVIGLVTAQNGICTSYRDFDAVSDSIQQKIEEGTLLITLYNPSKGLLSDLNRVSDELSGKETSIISRTRQFMVSLADRLSKINPTLLWMHIVHSEAGLIAHRAIEKMARVHRMLLANQLYLYAIASARPIPTDFAFEVFNVYSARDAIAKRFVTSYLNHPNYNIEMIPTESRWWEWSGFIADHAMMGPTYQEALEKKIDDLRGKYGFYDGKCH